ncbi:H-type lectin domain-containing protein [Streptomyces sp. NPDC052644]
MANLATPRTWVVGETVSAAMMNAEIRDQMNILIGREIKTGTMSISFTGVDSYTAPTVTFPGAAFSTTPVVIVTIPTTSGSTSRWHARATSITTTSFVPFFQSGTSGATATWSAIACPWVAIVS